MAPLAISFYTFQQISFLVDVARGKVELEGLVRYMSFVAFFPTLLAGPITLYSEMGPQLGIRPQRKGVAQNLLIGLIIFSLGLFKKTVLADTIGLWVDPIFAACTKAAHRDFFLGWGTAFAYTLQIYFDFSGYCDMAIGVARMLGIVLPLNFFSPLRSTSISDLWRRWHMTLGRFVRIYIHQPLSIPLARFAAEKGYGKWTATDDFDVPADVSVHAHHRNVARTKLDLRRVRDHARNFHVHQRNLQRIDPQEAAQEEGQPCRDLSVMVC